MVTREEVLLYLGIDYADDMVNSNIDRLINTADSYLKGSIGVNYPVNDPRVKELALIIISDLYENRGLYTTVSGNTRRLVEDFSMQLRVELEAVNNETV